MNVWNEYLQASFEFDIFDFFFPKKKLYGDYFYNSRIYFYVHVCVTDLYNFIILVT